MLLNRKIAPGRCCMRKLFGHIIGSALLLASAIFFAGANSVCGGNSQVDWPTLGFTQFVTNTFTEPTFITHAHDGSGRLFIVSKPGQVWIIQSNSVLPQPFLDISARVLSSGNEQGVLSMAFAPGFATNGHFYVAYTRDPDGDICISRFQMTSNTN